jgi:hypothetical protein
MHPWGHVFEGVYLCVRFFIDQLTCVKMAAFHFYLQSGKQKCGMGWGQQSSCFWSKIPWWKKKCETVYCHDATGSSFVTKGMGKVFAYFQSVAIKCHNNMPNWLFGLPMRIFYAQSPWSQRKLWASFWLCSSSFLPFSVCLELSIPFKLPYTAHDFLPICLSNHCQGLCPTFTHIYTGLH